MFLMVTTLQKSPISFILYREIKPKCYIELLRPFLAISIILCHYLKDHLSFSLEFAKIEL